MQKIETNQVKKKEKEKKSKWEVATPESKEQGFMKEGLKSGKVGDVTNQKEGV